MHTQPTAATPTARPDHPNVVRMNAFIDDCLAEADAKAGADRAEYLAACEARIESLIENLSLWCQGKAQLRKGLDGVTAFDLLDAQSRIGAAQHKAVAV